MEVEEGEEVDCAEEYVYKCTGFVRVARAYVIGGGFKE